MSALDAHERAGAVIDRHADALVAVSRQIHARPELGFAEHDAVSGLTALLATQGFEIDTGTADLDTAFVASKGSGSLRIAFCAEYDALPGIGHACGHNLIAGASVGAALGFAAVADDLDVEVLVVGTPAEESGGGKVLLLERGAFDGVHAALMAHPGPVDLPYLPCLASSAIEIGYTGVAAHAAAAPHLGKNAADALTVAQVAIGLLRQHLRPLERVHGVTLHAGEAPNVIPASAAARYLTRARNIADVEALEARVTACFQAGALATGTSVAVARSKPIYSHLEHDLDLTAAYVRHAATGGRTMADPAPSPAGGAASTDMANVSLELPAIHPLFSVGSSAVPHHPDFTAAADTTEAYRSMLSVAKALAFTAIDAATTPQLRRRLLSRERNVG